MSVTTTATSADRRSAAIEPRTVGPALLVLALAVLMSVVLPAIDGATSYRDQVDTGDVAQIADGLTMIPTPGWDLATGALGGHTRSPLGTTATTEVVDGSVELQVQTAPFDGTPSALLTHVNKIDADLERLRGGAAGKSRRYAVRTRQGAVGVAEDFVGAHKQGTVVALVFRAGPQSTRAEAQATREGVVVLAAGPPGPRQTAGTCDARDATCNAAASKGSSPRPLRIVDCVERTAEPLLGVGRQVPFAEGGRRIPVALQRLRERLAVLGQHRRVTRERPGELADHAEAHGVMVATGHQRRASRRAQRRRGEAVVAEPFPREPLERRPPDRPAEGTRIAKAGVVGQHEQDVRRVLRGAVRTSPRSDENVTHPVGMMPPRRRHGTIGPALQYRRSRPMRGTGRVVFAATMLLLVGTLNIIYGIGALDGANVFVNDQRYVLTDLNTLGWVLIVLGVIQLAGGFSLMAGNTYGRVIGIIGGSLGAIGALLSIGGNYPWWSLAIFFLCIYIVHGIIVYGQDERAYGSEPR
jgi:hypothetical protein